MTSDTVASVELRVDDLVATLWHAAGGLDPAAPIVLIGHGGGQHQAHPAVTGRARMCVAAGLNAAALDLPGHGSRPTSAADSEFVAELQRRMKAAESVADLVASHNSLLAGQAVPEWSALLDRLQRNECANVERVGFWGLSLGGALGLSLAAHEPRIAAAAVGLCGGDRLLELAGHVSATVQFVMQWDDEQVARADALALFDAIGSQHKTLHANPGRHLDVPIFEREAAVTFLARALASSEDDS